MDALTAGTAFVVMQVCLALTTIGLHYAAPHEKCTARWAIASLLISMGVLIVVWNAGAPRHAALLVGNSLLVYGSIMHWWGLQVFFRRTPTMSGWYFALAFTVLLELLLQAHADAVQRTLFVCSGLVLGTVLLAKEIWPRSLAERSAGRMIAMLGVLLVLATYSLRALTMLANSSTFLPTSNVPIAVMVTFIFPMGGIMLFSSGLFLLYFERIVNDKHHLATHDELTGIWNRRAIALTGERELDMARRFGRPIAVAFVDIDFFKAINDRHGHQAGDDVLVALAQLLGESCRAIDLVGRFGGEEFLIVLPGVDADSAEIVGRKLLEVVSNHRFAHCETLTVSIGLAVVPGDHPHDLSWRGLIKQADNALYDAKAAGRNCVRINRQATQFASANPVAPAQAA
jgi:diguanylate cyclase (GGDEF)-like protein